MEALIRRSVPQGVLYEQGQAVPRYYPFLPVLLLVVSSPERQFGCRLHLWQSGFQKRRGLLPDHVQIRHAWPQHLFHESLECHGQGVFQRPVRIQGLKILYRLSERSGRSRRSGFRRKK